MTRLLIPCQNTHAILACLHRRLSEYGLRFWFAQRAVEMGYKRFAIMCM